MAVVVVAPRARPGQPAPRSAPRRTRRGGSVAAFYGGLALLLLAVTSPIDYWADDYFFVHMVEHILIAFFAPS